jgi:CMP/dCMP kinase
VTASPEPAASVPVVAIDGPSGSGKGTVSRLLAQRLGWHRLDSGALYRLVAYAGQRARLAPDDAAGHTELARRMQVESDQSAAEDRVLLDGADVTEALRDQETAAGASRVAAWPSLRAALVARQREAAVPPGLVADGRDMGTVIFPQAALKIFLTASPEERAKRRYKQLKGKDSGVSLPALSREIAERDRRDATRSVAPLVPAADAIVLDSTTLSAVEVTDAIMAIGRARALWR